MMGAAIKSQTSFQDIHSSKWWSMLVIGMGVFMGTLDNSSVNVSLPTLVEELNTDFATIQWVVLGYILVITSMMLSAARLGDMVVKKKLYNWGLLIFTLGSTLCGFAPSVGWLIAFRIFQGLGAVVLQALGAAIVVEVFPPNERGRALGIIGGIVSVGIASGPAIGGIIIGLMGWRWVFLIKLPIGLLIFIASLLFLPSKAPKQTDQTFDITGALIMLCTLICFALGMTMGQNSGFGNEVVRMLLAASGIGLLAFLVIENKMKQPIVDLGLFRNLQFSLNLIMGIMSFMVMGGMFILPFYLQLVKGYSTLQMGLMMMASPVAMGVVAPLAGSMSDHFGTRKISIIGLFVIIAGCFSVSMLTADTTVIGYYIRVGIVGLGMGCFQSPNNSAIMGAAPPERLGVASGLMALSRNFGNTIGMPMMGAICTAGVMASAKLPELTNITKAPAPALVSGITGTFRMASIIMFISTVLYLIILWIERSRNARRIPEIGLKKQESASRED